jgi:hypothetical protein
MCVFRMSQLHLVSHATSIQFSTYCIFCPFDIPSPVCRIPVILNIPLIAGGHSATYNVTSTQLYKERDILFKYLFHYLIVTITIDLQRAMTELNNVNGPDHLRRTRTVSGRSLAPYEVCPKVGSRFFLYFSLSTVHVEHVSVYYSS